MRGWEHVGRKTKRKESLALQCSSSALSPRSHENTAGLISPLYIFFLQYVWFFFFLQCVLSHKFPLTTAPASFDMFRFYITSFRLFSNFP